MITVENSDIDVSLRRHRKELYTTGIGYILFGIWSVLKVIMSLFLGDLTVETVFPKEGMDPEDYMIFRIVYTLVVFIFALIVFLVHLRVGLGAIKASRGGKSWRYLIEAGFLLAMNFYTLKNYFYNSTGEQIREISDTTIASLLVDITVTLLLIGMFWSDYMVRKLSKDKAQAA